MKKFLAISWAFPPVILPRALQVSRTLKRLRENGWQASVLCVDPRSIQRTFKSDPALGAEYRDLFEEVIIPSPEDTLPVRAVWRIFPGLSLLPDPRSVWIPFALSAGRRLLRKGGFCGILSFGQPWSDHLIARRLGQDFDLPWIAHFSDPWVDSPYYHTGRLTTGIRKRMEHEVIRDASGVIFVSEETRDLVMRKYPGEWAPKAYVIPHCFEPREVKPALPQSSAPLRVVYTGGFYGRRTPVNLFKALALLNQNNDLEGSLFLELIGAGIEPYRTMISDLGLGNVVQISPMAPYQKSQDIAGQADVLLVIDAPSLDVNVFLPSKLIEYLAFRKPILGITPLKGATAGLLRSLDCPLADTGDIDGIAAILRELIRKKRAGSLSVSPDFDRNAARYDIRQTTRQYLELLEKYF